MTSNGLDQRDNEDEQLVNNKSFSSTTLYPKEQEPDISPLSLLLQLSIHGDVSPLVWK